MHACSVILSEGARAVATSPGQCHEQGAGETMINAWKFKAGVEGSRKMIRYREEKGGGAKAAMSRNSFSIS